MAVRRLLAAAVVAGWVTLRVATPALAASPSPSPSPTQDLEQVCHSLPPDDAVRAGIRLACDEVAAGPGGPVRDVQQGVAGDASQAGQAVASDAEAAFTGWLANGAIWVIQGVTQQVAGSSTTPSLDPGQATAFTQVYGRVVGVALSLSVLLVLIAVIEATLTQRPGALRRVVVGIAVSGIGLGAVPAATASLVKITDDLSWYVAADQSQQVARGLGAMIQLLQQTNPATGAAAFALTALGIMVGGAVLWLELVTRGALIYLFLGVVPLACAAVQWPRLEGVLQKVLFGGLALILSKLLIAIALAVGFAVLSTSSGLQSLIGGMFLVLIAAFMPFATARVLPLAAEEMSLGHEGRSRRWLAGSAGTTAQLAAAVGFGRASASAARLPVAGSMGSGRLGGDPGPTSGARDSDPPMPRGPDPAQAATAPEPARATYTNARSGEKVRVSTAIAMPGSWTRATSGRAPRIVPSNQGAG